MELYKIAIRVSLVNQVTGPLGLIARQLAKTHGTAKALEKQLQRIKLLGLSGAALTAGGFLGLRMIDAAVKPAKEYAHQLEQMNVAGMKHLEILRATKAAWDASKVVPTSSVMENLAAIRELRMVFGHTGEAIQYMPTVQKIQAVLSVLKGQRGGQDEAYTVAKALEMKGAVQNPAKFTTQADMMTKAIIAAGGKVSAQDFLQAFKYGRLATIGWNNAFTYTVLPTLIQEMKSAGGLSNAMGGPGSALMSAYAAVVGGTIAQKALGVWDKLGLLDPHKLVWTTTHHLKGVRPGGIRGADVFQRDPFEWTEQYLVPALKKAGYTTPAQERQAIQYLFPNRTAGFMMATLATQSWKVLRDKRIIGTAMGLSGYNDLLKKDPYMAQLALANQWHSLMAILGFQVMPVLLRATMALIDEFRRAAAFFSKHSTLGKSLMYLGATLSGLAAVGGPILMAAAGFAALKLALGSITTAGLLVNTAKGLTALASGLGKLGLVAAAGAGGYAIGRYAINPALNYATGGSFGSWAYNFLHPDENANLFHFATPGSTVHHTHVHLDGRQIAHVVTKHQARAALAPPAAAGHFDGNLGLTPVMVTP